MNQYPNFGKTIGKPFRSRTCSINYISSTNQLESLHSQTMNMRKIILYVLGFVICVIIRYTAGESSTCLAVYKKGGAPAVFQSAKCPQWSLQRHDRERQPAAGRCQSATRQGRRKYMEDRIFCTLDIPIRFPDANGIRETSVGIVAVFDGHNGEEASEMASKLLLEYFTLHTYFLLDNAFSFLPKTSKGMLPNKDEKVGEHVLDIGRNKFTLSTIFDRAFHLEILKESLLRAINDIDVTFCEEASRYSLNSGSTATIILIADGQILVANIGDSKAFICSQIFQSPQEAKATLMRLYKKKREDGVSVRMKDYRNFENGLTHLLVKELTNDHHPDRSDERSRVESAGGHVLEWAGVSRVNGQLAVSRAIGDVSYKRFGVISIPEVTNWQLVTGNDSYLVVASDGVFEKQSPQDVCDVLRESEYNSLCLYSLADCIVDNALERGSMDNVAAVVVPFGVETLTSQQSSDVRLQSYVDEQILMHQWNVTTNLKPDGSNGELYVDKQR